MSDERPGSNSEPNYLSADADTDRDVLAVIINWRDRWQRYGRGARGASMTIDTLTLAIDEITRLRGVVDRLLGEQRKQVLEAIIAGRRGARL